jgi:hypothetical protein
MRNAMHHKSHMSHVTRHLGRQSAHSLVTVPEHAAAAIAPGQHLPLASQQNHTTETAQQTEEEIPNIFGHNMN